MQINNSFNIFPHNIFITAMLQKMFAPCCFKLQTKHLINFLNSVQQLEQHPFSLHGSSVEFHTQESCPKTTFGWKFLLHKSFYKRTHFTQDSTVMKSCLEVCLIQRYRIVTSLYLNISSAKSRSQDSITD